MSLQLWLPMTKDLTQQGLSNITATNNGATLSDSGKLGKCYSFDGSDDYINLGSSIGSYFDTSPFSFTFWIKSLENGTRGVIFGSYGSSSETNYFNIEVNSGSHSDNALRFCWKGLETYSSAGMVTYNAWVHIAVVWDGTKVSFYKNGTLLNSNAISPTSIPTGNTYYIGRDGRTGGTAFYGYLNDFRFYDHALSPKEVEVLSRGLVCHYPLNGGGRGGDNLLKTSPKSHSAGSYNAYELNLSENLVAGQTYTIQLWDATVTNASKTADQLGIWVYWGGGSVALTSWSGSDFDTNGHANHLQKTITITSSQASGSGATNAWLVLYNSVPIGSGTRTMKVGRWKVEKGSVATPWIPNSADTEYTTMGYSDTTEYDVSGNGNNGTKNGTIAYLTDTPRYNVSTNIKGASSYIQIPNLTTTGFSNSYSFAWWGKVPSYQGYMMWGFSDGQRLNGIFNGNLWNTGDGASNPLYVPGTTTQVTVPTTKVWHHWVMTGDGTTCKVYQDGVLWGQAKTYKSISGTTIYINGWDAGTSYTYGDYQMSDFRIYATALSATQVAELYNMAVSVANNGALLGYELVEV